MTYRLPFIRRFTALMLTAVAFSLPFTVGCSGRPSQEELSLLEERRLAAEAAEKQILELQAEQARLERKIAEKRGEKQELQAKMETVKAAVANWPND